MNVGNVRVMDLGWTTRMDTLLPDSRQKHVVVGADPVASYRSLCAVVRSSGFDIGQCKAPPMLAGCNEPLPAVREQLKGIA